MNTARLRVVLRDVEPAVAQVIDVPASATLPELHELLQAAIGFCSWRVCWPVLVVGGFCRWCLGWSCRDGRTVA